MFCEKCGSENTENAFFCKSCGTQLKKDGQKTVSEKNAVIEEGSAEAISRKLKKNKKNKLIGIAAVAIVLVLAVIVGVKLFGGRSYKAAVDEFFEAMFDGDAKKMLDMIPEKVLEKGKKNDYSGYLETIEELNDELSDMKETLDDELGRGWKYSYELTAEDITGEDLLEIKAKYLSYYDVSVSEAMNVYIYMTVEGKNDKVSDSIELGLLKSGNSWYIDLGSIVNIFQ